MTKWEESPERQAVVDDLYRHGFLSYAPTSSVAEIAELHGIQPILVNQVLMTERGKVLPERPVADDPARKKILEVVKDWHRLGYLDQAIDGMHTLCRELGWTELLADMQLAANEHYDECKAQRTEVPE